MSKHFATPMLAIRDAARAVEYYKEVFEATELLRLQDPDGIIQHAEIQIGDALLMIAEEFPEHNQSPQSLGGSSVILQLHVPDVDAMVSRAVASGAKLLRPVEDQFYGERTGKIEDPFGHVWLLATRIEDVSSEEILKRFQSFYQNQ